MNTKRLLTILWMAALVALAPACGGGGGGGGSPGAGGKDLVLMDVSVASESGVPLNAILKLTFNQPLDPDTVRPDTIQIREGPNLGRQVPGDFRVDGNVVEFYPRLPVLPDLSDAGFSSGTGYRVILPGTPKAATVRSATQDRLTRKREETFETANLADELFVDNFLDPGSPEVLFVNPADSAADVPTGSEIRLTFNRRALHPATVTAANVHLTLVSRDGVVLERPVQGEPVLEQSHGSVLITWQPRFPLSDRATYRLTVERRVQDLVGRDILDFESTFTTREEAPRPGAVVLDFDAADKTSYMDEDATTAAWDDDKPGELSALFTAAGGTGSAGDLAPSSSRNFTPDDFDRGVEVRNVAGVETDVINFRSIDIPEGVTVRFSSRPEGPSRPVLVVSLKDIRIDGTLTVDGGKGQDGEINSSTSTIPKALGGAAGPGGSHGADNYTGTLLKTAPAESAPDVNYGGGGGQGGRVSGHSNYSYSGGGGGGSSRTSGQPGTKGGYGPQSSYNGAGGAGGLSTADQGLGLNVERIPNVGGSGGGAGGLGYYWPTSTNWRNGAGAGGGGGGAVTLQGAGSIVIGPRGKITAAGGAGGRSTRNSYYYGGGGGGGAGGSILVRATDTIRFEAGAELDVAGGSGGTYAGTYAAYKGGQGGQGGEGYLRLESSEDENSPGKPRIEGLGGAKVTYSPASEGLFLPRGGGVPSVGQTRWVNLGVFDPEVSRPSAADIAATLFNDTMTIEVQMAAEDRTELGSPDLGALDLTDFDGDGAHDDTLDPRTLSEWTPLSDIADLNGMGYQFIRIRVKFQLDSNQGPADPLPSLDRLRVPFKF